ncbi:MAG TPA: type II toxin-antitoxin system RelE/ParE family toxin [Thermoanaerobaculia bacterium]|nr:type II toxin-antitoxin system RelE/ParE family toxin [Thermoanaerobaculia bacterium]
MELAWSQTAVDDLAALRGWIGRDVEPLADRITDRIFETVERALPFPRIGRMVSEVGDDSVREFLFRTLRIVYRIEQGRIVVLAILSGGRPTERREPRRWEVY